MKLFSFFTIAALGGGAFLSAAGENDGWVCLFDGKTLAGWKTLNGRPIRSWVAEAGMLHYVPPTPKAGN